jgi:hypothetical protein
MSNEAKLQQVERERDEAIAKLRETERTLDEASTLLHLVWRESADLFGDRASSHYRSEIGARIEKVTGKRPKP